MSLNKQILKLLTLMLLLTTTCIPTPHTEPNTPKWVVLYLIELENYRNQDCLIGGLSRTVNSSGILICVRNYGDHCRSDLKLNNISHRNILISKINSIALQYPNCSIAATNAIQQLNQLALPAHLLMYISGGTIGPHISSLNYAELRVGSCAAIGMQDNTFLGGAIVLANESQMDFLASPRGLVAIQDIGGTCRAALALTLDQSSTVASFLAGTLTRTAVCDYGADDGTLTDCPASLDHSDLRFSGISSW